MVMNCLSFCLSRNALNSPSLFKDSLKGIGFLIDSVFVFVFIFFYHFEYISPLLSGLHKVSDKKSTDNLTEDPLHVISSPSWFFTRVHLCLWLSKFNYNVSQWGCLRVHPTKSSLSFLDLYTHDFYEIWEVPLYIWILCLLLSLSLLLLEFPQCLKVFQGPLGSVPFFQNFSLCSLNWTPPPKCSNLPLNPSVTIIFNFRINF